MKISKILLTILLATHLLPLGFVSAQSFDFNIEQNMTISYSTNTDFVNVTVEYIRKVNNNDYFFPASGEKVISIPDITSHDAEAITSERLFKKESIRVTDSQGKELKYEIKEVYGEGIYVHIPNYRQTTPSTPYKIYISYNTHDYVKAVYNNVILQGPSLPADTEFEIYHSESKTNTKVDYSLRFLVDEDISELAKIWPEGYNISDEEGRTIYSFPSSSRIGRNPYIEFGTSQIYKFELEYNTPKTDELIPEDYSKVLKALSTNIYEISLPRYFDETNQVVKIESMTPTPTKIRRDAEGNIVATFEVPANKEDVISIVGYIWVEQNTFESKREIPSITLAQYFEQTKDKSEYLKDTRFWEVNDTFIQEEANKIMEGKETLMELIVANYQYVNDNLDYDQNKANSENERIGAKSALQGGGSVCMEYADVMITLLRAQGIPARAAIGYANLALLSHTPQSQVRHQWVQVWVPDYGWLSIDPTLESENMDIGQNIDKVLWETFSSDSLSNTKIYSADLLSNIDKLDFKISVYAVRETEIKGELKSYEDISKVEEESNDLLNKIVKTSSFGKAVIIVAPIILILLLLVVLISFLRYTVKKYREKRKTN